ncbi:MAG: lysoplasmalogenase family protein [Bacilli bacterium]|jgi:uncharacterized membrane protein YhhN|nr:hypothetical protein [Acholeplasmataceae bacterium]
MSKKLRNWITVLFILLMLTIYASFIFFRDKIAVPKVQYLGIVLCLLFTFAIFENRKDAWFLRAALFFTVISDWFLVIKQSDYLLALITFTIAQFFYAIRLWENDGSVNRNKKHILMRSMVLIIMELGFLFLFKILKIKYDSLIFMGVMYFTFLLMNVLLAFMQLRKNILFPIGMTLFLCCDVLVGLSNLQNYIALAEPSFLLAIINSPVDLIWIFYFPSQALLALSILTNRKKL